MYGYILLFVCFFSAATEEQKEPEDFVVYVWGVNPLKFDFTFKINFLNVFRDNIVTINYIDYPKGNQPVATYTTSLRQNTRTTHTLVEITDLKDYDYFVIVIKATNTFDYFAYITNGEIHYDMLRSLPSAYWDTTYALMTSIIREYNRVLIFSPVNQTVNVQSHLVKDLQEFSHGYSMVRLDIKDTRLSVTNYQPFLHQFLVEPGKYVQVVYFSAKNKFACLTIRNTQGRTIGKEVLYHGNKETIYTFYGRKIRKDGVQISLTYKMMAPFNTRSREEMILSFLDGTQNSYPSILPGYVYQFRDIAKLEASFPLIIYANNSAAGVYFQIECAQQFKSSHVILNPLYPNVEEAHITVTGTQDALAHLKLNDEPLVLTDVSVIYEGDKIYTGYATISTEPVKISSTADLSIYVQAGNPPDTYYSFTSFGRPSDLMPPSHFDTTIKESFEETTTELSSTNPTEAEETTSVATTLKTSPIRTTEEITTKAKLILPGYNEFKIVCDPGFYGINCASRCTCGQNCRIDGTCTNTPCRLGTFGEGCKHADLSVHANEINPPELTDGDKDTSVNLGQVKVEVNLHEPTPTNSFTFVFKDGSDVTGITKEKFDIQVWDEETKSMVAFTEDYNVVIEDDKTVTVNWKRPRIVQKMQVTVSTDQNATSFHIDGGHKAEILLSGEGNEGSTKSKSQLFTLQVGDTTIFPNLAKNLTDGDRFSSCVDTDETDIMTMTFEADTLLLRLMIYTPGAGKEWKAEVVCYYTTDKEVFKTEVISSEKRIYQVNVNKKVLKVRIKLLSGSIIMCEIEPFTDPKGPLIEASTNESTVTKDFSMMWIILCLMILLACFLLGVLYLLGRKRASLPPEKEMDGEK